MCRPIKYIPFRDGTCESCLNCSCTILKNQPCEEACCAMRSGATGQISGHSQSQHEVVCHIHRVWPSSGLDYASGRFGNYTVVTPVPNGSFRWKSAISPTSRWVLEVPTNCRPRDPKSLAVILTNRFAEHLGMLVAYGTRRTPSELEPLNQLQINIFL